MGSTQKWGAIFMLISKHHLRLENTTPTRDKNEGPQGNLHQSKRQNAQTLQK